MSPEKRLFTAMQNIEESRRALYCLSNSLAIEAGHIPDAEDIERQHHEAAVTSDHALAHMSEVEDAFRAVRENGFNVTFNRFTAVTTCEHGYRIAEKSTELPKPITVQYIGCLAVVGEQISKARYGRRLTALVVSETEGIPQEERMNLIDNNGTVLEPSVSPYKKPRSKKRVPTLKPRLVSYRM